MEISTKQLRTQPGRIISMVRSGQDVTITFRGRPSAKIIPINQNIVNRKKQEIEDEAFGLWRDREDIGDVEQFVRNMRKGRKF